MPAAPPEAARRTRLPAWRIVIRLVAAFRSHSFAADGFWVVATQIIGKGSATLMSLLLARMLTVGDFSAFTYLFATGTLLSSYVAAGLPQTVSRVVAEGRDHASWTGDDRLGAVLLVAAVSSGAAIAGAPLYLPWLLSDEVPISGPLLIAAALAITWTALAQAALYASGQFRAAFPPVVVGTVLVLVCSAAAIVVGSSTLLILGNIAAILAPAIAYTRRLYRAGVLAPLHWQRRPGRAALREVLVTALPGLGCSVIYASINWLLARTLIEQQETADQFNEYAIGLQWFSLVLFVPLAFGQVLFPKFVQKTRSSTLGLAQIVVPPALTFGIVLCCAVAGTVLTPLISWVYGGHYSFSRLFVFTMLLAAALSGAVNLLGSFVMAARGFAAWLLVNIASGAVAGLLLWLLPLGSAFAAARVLCLVQLTPLVIASVLVVHHRAKHPLTHGSREEVVAVPAATPLNDQR